jgi:4-diphosphocytidyl-2-C-methyl-D-erythritol kinase
MTNDPTRRLAPVVRLAPAKLNLTLAIVGRRSDGFHALHSVMVPLALADRLSVAVLPAGDDTIHTTGFDPGPPEANLALKAIRAARAVVRGSGTMTPPLAARLDKQVPVAAGLAGGSSDAAAAIDAAIEAWGADLAPERRAELAASLGSDVPFFLAGGPALVEGRGERVTPLHGIRGDDQPGLLLVTPAVGARTADVFAAWAAGAMSEPGVARRTSEHFASEFGSGLSGRQLIERAGVLAAANDLLPAAASVVPGLVQLRRAMTRMLGRPIGLSGSGPTLWALYPTLEAATEAAASVRTAVNTGTIPSPGKEPPFVAATTIQRSDQ